VANYFQQDGNQQMQHAARKRIRDAIVATQWADTLPHILRVVQDHQLLSCQDKDYVAIKAVAERDLAPERLTALKFSEAAGVIATVSRVCGALSGPEKVLFEKIGACSAFWSFIAKENFYGG